MPFNRIFEYIIQKDDKSFINVTFNRDNIDLNYFNNNYIYTDSINLINGSYSFVDIDFDINTKDNIFGVLNNKIDCLFYLFFNDTFLIKTPVINYNSENLAIKFPTIKCDNSNTNIFCYLINKHNRNSCDILHIFKQEQSWQFKIIDSINFGILSNFEILNTKDKIYIFYYKIVNNYEEIFMSYNDISTNKWSPPIQLTNTHNNKVYLSVLKHRDYFHIIFSENIDNKYYCNYINLWFDNNIVKIYNYTILSNNVACTFPHLIKNNNILFSQWIEYNDLFTSFSIDNGMTWSSPKTTFEEEDYTFTRSIIKSNYLKNKGINVSTLFSLKNSPLPLGIKI